MIEILLLLCVYPGITKITVSCSGYFDVESPDFKHLNVNNSRYFIQTETGVNIQAIENR